MKKLSSQITHDDWLAELSKLSDMGINGDGLTVAEISAATGLSLNVIRNKLKLAKNAGKLTRALKRVERLDGAMTAVSCYKIKR